MIKHIQDILVNYKNCLFFDNKRLTKALNGDIVEISNIGTDFARSQMFEDAIKCWEYIISNMSTNPETYNNLGVSYYYGNGVDINYEKAVHYYEKAAAKGHPYGMYNLAVANEYGNGTPKDINKAIKFYQKAAELGINEAIDALIRLDLYDEHNGFSFYSRNIDDQSFISGTNYNSCFDIANKKAKLAIIEYGTIMGNVFKEEAISLYLKAISFRKTSEAYFALATLYKDFQDYTNAINYYKEVLNIDPYSYESYNDLGFCFYQMKADKIALDYFKKSYDIKPSSMVLKNMGNCYSNIGDIQSSIECYILADQLDNDYKDPPF